MKTLPIFIIISSVVLSAIVISVGVIASQSSSKQITYQSEIHEPYNMTIEAFGSVTIQNRTFFADDISKTLNTTNATEMEWYGIKFSFPHGSELSYTPGGTIFESYVTFPDDQVPYRIAIGQSSLPGSPLYDYTTVLSTHVNPQVGFTLHNGTVQLLVNYPKVHSDLQIIGLNETYETSQPIDFQIEAKGFGYLNGGENPKLWIERQDGSLVWSQQDNGMLSLCCPPELADYDRKFNFTDLGGPITIDKTGSYNLVVSYGAQKIQKQFSVIAFPSTTIFDTGITPKYVNVTGTNFTIDYNIAGNGKITEAKMDSLSKSLILSLDTTSNGTLIVSIPRALLEIKKNDRGEGQFYMLADGQETLFKEIHTTPMDRIFSIPFQNGTKNIQIMAIELI